jgi:hypothetical protein
MPLTVFAIAIPATKGSVLFFSGGKFRSTLTEIWIRRESFPVTPSLYRLRQHGLSKSLLRNTVCVTAEEQDYPSIAHKTYFEYSAL